MIWLDDVHKAYGGRTLFEGLSLRFERGERVGVVGPNGAGKSTLMKLLARVEQPDAGRVGSSNGVRIGMLHQELDSQSDESALSIALRPDAEFARLETELHELPDRIAAAASELAEQERLSARLADAHERFAHLGGHDREARARRVLSGLGFSDGDDERPLRELSGGWAMRAELARLLVSPPDVLLLDEPTNHLDLESVLWLQGHLANADLTLILISHDRAFLEGLTRVTLEVDRGVERYNGPFSSYVRQRDERRAHLEARAEAQARRIKETEKFIERFRYKATKARQVQSRIKALEKEERIVLEKDAKKVAFRFPQPPQTARIALELKSVAKSYGDKTVYRDLDFRLERGEKTVLVGPNGAGKSTLLKMLGGVLEFDAGTRETGLRASVGYYGQHRQEMLDLEASVLENAMRSARDAGETAVRSLLGAFLFRGDDVEKKAHVLSGGEKSRLALAMVLLDPPSVLLMDEPTIHLDMASVDALVRALNEFEGSLCFVSHDIHFIQQIAQRVVRIEHGAVHDYPGNWENYLWRRGKEATAASEAARAPASRTAPAEPTEPGGAGAAPDAERSGKARREERRREAEARNALAAKTRIVRAEIARLEKDMGRLQEQKTALETRLADPSLYDGGGDAVREAQQRHAEISRALEECEELWLERQSRLEDTLNEAEGLADNPA